MLRSIKSKEEFVRIVQCLKNVRRNHDIVNQRCQTNISQFGLNFIETYDNFGENIVEHNICIVNATSKDYNYGIVLLYGMDPITYKKKTLYRGYAIKIDIPDFYLAEIKEDVKKETETVIEKIVETPEIQMNERNTYSNALKKIEMMKGLEKKKSLWDSLPSYFNR